MIAGNPTVFFVIGNIGMTIFCATNNASCAGVKGKFLALEIATGDGEGNFLTPIDSEFGIIISIFTASMRQLP